MGEVLLQLNILDKSLKDYLKLKKVEVTHAKKGIDLTQF